MAPRMWFNTGYDPDRDPAVLRERELIAALRDHTDALRTSRRVRLPPPPTEYPVTEMDQAAARRIIRERARSLGLVVRGEE